MDFAFGDLAVALSSPFAAAPAAPLIAAMRAMKPPPRPSVAGLDIPGIASSPFGGAIGPMLLRRIQPWPTVHRFVVIQYTIRPVGKVLTKMTKMKGRAYISIRCVLSAVVGVRIVDSSWDTTYSTIRATSTSPVALTVRSGMKRKSCAPTTALGTSAQGIFLDTCLTASPQMSVRRSAWSR